MNPALVLGALLTVAGLAGYALGLATAYPGRAFSLTLVMVGLAVVAMHDALAAGSAEP